MVNEAGSKKSDIKVSNKLRKEKVQAPLTKIVVRKLPPTFTEEEFKNAISPVPENNYFTFVPADKRLGPHSFSRVYINFINPEEIYSFRDRFDGYVFVDQKGCEYPALVEYASFQKIPKSSHLKKDIRCGTIDEDPDYVAFLDLLQNPEAVSLPAIETLLEEIENIEKELKANNGVPKIKTPLLEYVEQRNRVGDKKRRKEYDRRKAREDEKRRRKDLTKEYRKRDDHYSREERDRERAKRREEEKLKWKERREERERQIKEKRTERAERYKSEKGEDRSSAKSKDVPPPQEVTDHTYEKKSPNTSYKGGSSSFKGDDRSPSATQKTKRYSEVRKKEEREKRRRDEDAKEERRDDVKENEREAEKREEEASDKREIRENEGGRKERDKYKKEERCEDDKEERDKHEKEERHKDKREEPNKDKDNTGKDNTEKIKEDKVIEESMCMEEEKTDRKEDISEEGEKDKKTEKRIRNKDRPAMQLYRPGQSRLKTRPPKSNEESGSNDQRASNDGSGGSGDQRVNNDGSSSSSCVSPVMETSEKGGDEGAGAEKGELKETYPGKPSNRGGYYAGRKSYTGTSKYRDSRKSNYYWDKDSYWEERHYGKYKDDYYEGNRGGGGAGGTKGRKGYSYYQERESKGKYATGKSAGKDQEASGSSSNDPSSACSQFKSLTFRRSTSQD